MGDPKQKIVVSANNIMEAIDQYRLIRNLIPMESGDKGVEFGWSICIGDQVGHHTLSTKIFFSYKIIKLVCHGSRDKGIGLT